MTRRAAPRALGCALACLAILVAGAAPGGAAPPAEDEFELGIRLCDEGRMAEALPIYERITKSHPFYAFGWLGLGWSLHYTGRYGEAIPAYEKAIELGATEPHQPMIEIARCYAALGRRAEAVAWVDRALASGLPSVDRLRSDERLASLRSDPTFRRLAAIVDTSRMTRTEGWRYDLALLAREIERVHYAPHRRLSRAGLTAAIDVVRRSIARLDDDRLAVEVMRIARRLGDGHTYAEAPFMGGERERDVPVLLGLFDDGLYVTGVAPGLEDLLWARVVTVEGKTPERVMVALDGIVGQDNAYRLKSRGPQLLRNPRLMKALGVARDADALELGVVDREGRARSVRLEGMHAPEVAWVRKPPEFAGELPRYARNRTAAYWFEYLPDSRALYFQYNAVAEATDETPEAFAERLSRAIDENDVDRLVVDLRWNGGGNVFLSRPILHAILTAKKVNRRGHVFVIAGRHTFSAAMIFAEQLERYTPAVFVGEPTGSSPNFVGETNFLTLPYSNVRVSLSNLYWQTSTAKDTRTWIPPRIFVPPTFESLEAGRDPALEAALAWDEGR